MNHSSHPRWESRGRRPGFDSGFSGGPGFGPEAFDFPFGPRRGDVRAAILGLLAEEAGSGYSLIKRIQERSEGAWRPSPGSVYPTLQQLVDEELIASTGGGGRASEFALTDEGRVYVDEHVDEIAAAWNVGADRADARAELREYRDAAGRLMRALWQFPHEATAEQRTRAIAEMEALRKSLYGILAE